MADCIYNLLVIRQDFQVCRQTKKESHSEVIKFTKRCAMSWIQWKINLRFYFLSSGRFCTKKSLKNWPILSTRTTISQKLKMEKLIFYSFRHIPHLSCKYKHFWKFEKHFVHLAKKKLVGGLHPPTGAAPMDPACFWIEDPSLNRLASTTYQQ